MARTSSGLLLYRSAGDTFEVLLVHPGGPYWSRKDVGAWSIPKGEIGPEEDPLETAKREVEEETGFVAQGDFMALTPVRQPGGKMVYAWAVRSDFDPAHLRSNTFALEWPPRSGQRQEFPEVDRAEWLRLPEARRKILPGQLPILEELEARVSEASRSG